MLFSCVFVFAACDNDDKDDKDTEKKGTVPNSDPEKAKAALEEAGYIVQYSKTNAGGIKATIKAIKIDEDGKKLGFINIVYCEDKDAANVAWERDKSALEDAKTEMGEIYNCDENEIVLKKSGTIIYMGTNDAVEAAK